MVSLPRVSVLRRNATKDFLKLGKSCFSCPSSSNEELLEKLDVKKLLQYNSEEMTDHIMSSISPVMNTGD